MAVICKCPSGFVVDHNQAVCLSLSCLPTTQIDSFISNFKLKKELFYINEPYMMDSQYEAAQSKVKDGESSSRKRERKRKSELNDGEQKFQKYHASICDFITTAYNELIPAARQTGYFTTKGTGSRDNNTTAREMASRLHGDRGSVLQDLCSPMSTEGCETSSVVLDIASERTELKLLNRLCKNPSSCPTVIKFHGDQYIIPGNSSFLLADFSWIDSLHSNKDFAPFDLIVLDPPWENKSVKRKKMYHSLSNEDLTKISIPSLAAEGALIVVWVTNRTKHIDFVKDTLFPAWCVQYVTQWFWLKVTTSGEMVYDIHSEHKKPYEILIIGQYVVLPGNQEPHGEGPGKGLPVNQTIISVPCALHSVKPPLNDILRDYLPRNARCLELFARNLWPGWTSWGNEVLLHQHINFYESSETELKPGSTETDPKHYVSQSTEKSQGRCEQDSGGTTTVSEPCKPELEDAEADQIDSEKLASVCYG